MTTLKLIGYTGEVPRLLPRLLGDSAAQRAFNVRLDNGGLTPVRTPRFETTIEGVVNPKTIYRHAGNWLAWSTVVDAAPGPVASDRLYYTGDGPPKMRIGADVYPMAVARPTGALTATATDNETRTYAFTYVDNSLTESAASPISSSIEWNSNRAVTLTDFEDIPTLGVGTITKQRIYRNDGTNWYFVAERTASTSPFNDTVETATLQALPPSSAVPAPSLAPTADFTYKESLTTRVYAYTFVTAFSEESEPSDLSNPVEWEPGQTVTLTGIQNAPAGRNITKQRFYRSQTGQGGTDLFFIAERDVSAADFVDSVGVGDFNEILPSLEYNAPPDTLAGLIPLPNGMMAAFSGKDLYFCEPYYPHAWPEKYILTMDYPIVALGAYGTTLVVTTTGNPYLVNGTAPENMVSEKLELNLPCINARGLVDLGYAVAYPSMDGLVMASSSGAVVVTEQLMTRNDWLKTGPANIIGGQFAGRYFASYEYVEPSGNAFRGTTIFDTTGSTPFILRTNHKADAFFYDIQESALYFLVGNEVFEWDALGQVNETMTWRSKQFVLPAPTNFGVILIDGASSMSEDEQAAYDDEREEVESFNAIEFAKDTIGGEINGSMFNQYPINGDILKPAPQQKFVSVSVIADGKLVATISQMNRMKRLPAGFLAKSWEIEVNSNSEISEIVLATAGQELRGS